jgi:hypothetical protein
MILLTRTQTWDQNLEPTYFCQCRKESIVFLSMVVNQKQPEPLSPNKMSHMTIKKQVLNIFFIVAKTI